MRRRAETSQPLIPFKHQRNSNISPFPQAMFQPEKRTAHLFRALSSGKLHPTSVARKVPASEARTCSKGAVDKNEVVGLSHAKHWKPLCPTRDAVVSHNLKETTHRKAIKQTSSQAANCQLDGPQSNHARREPLLFVRNIIQESAPGYVNFAEQLEIPTKKNPHKQKVKIPESPPKQKKQVASRSK